MKKNQLNFSSLRRCSLARMRCKLGTTGVFLLLFLLQIPLARSQNNTVVAISGYGPTPCSPGDECCMKFTVIINKPTKWLKITLNGMVGADPGCLNPDCLYKSLIDFAGYYDTVFTDINGSGGIDINLVPRNDSIGLVVGDTIQFAICPVWEYHSVYCFVLWDEMNWQSYSSAWPVVTPNDAGGEELNWCDEPIGGCSLGCDKVTHSKSGDLYTFCVTRSGGLIPGAQVIISFTPPLKQCDTLSWDGYIDSALAINRDTLPNGSVLGPDSEFFDGTEHYFWSKDTVFYGFNLWYLKGADTSGGAVTDTLQPDAGHDLGPCGTFCFYVKGCQGTSPNDPEKHVLTIYTTPGDTIGCTQVNDSDSFKKSASKGEQFIIGNNPPNYPNPFGPNSGFNTTIPFVTAATGLVKISIFDESGKGLTTQTMEATYAGEHFFYFTGDRLPAGRYFYNIEFPEGTVIAKHSMLLVK